MNKLSYYTKMSELNMYSAVLPAWQKQSFHELVVCTYTHMHTQHGLLIISGKAVICPLAIQLFG